MPKREYPELPMVGVGGIVISGARALLVCRGTEPARGEWTIPGGLLEVGETLAEGVARELREETGLTVRVIELVEALERIFLDDEAHDLQTHTAAQGPGRHAGAALDGADWDGRTQTAAEHSVSTSGLDLTGRGSAPLRSRPRYHYVILDYLCEVIAGEPAISEEISDLAFILEQDMDQYALTPAAARVLHKAFAMARARGL